MNELLCLNLGRGFVLQMPEGAKPENIEKIFIVYEGQTDGICAQKLELVFSAVKQ